MFILEIKLKKQTFWGTNKQNNKTEAKPTTQETVATPVHTITATQKKHTADMQTIQCVVIVNP